jgi:hypothetical protein
MRGTDTEELAGNRRIRTETLVTVPDIQLVIEDIPPTLGVPARTRVAVLLVGTLILAVASVLGMARPMTWHLRL